MTNSFLYPKIWQALVLLAVVVGLQILVSIPFQILGWIKHPAVLALLGVLSFTPALVFGFTQARAPFDAVFPFTRVRVTLFVPLALLFLGNGVLLSEVDNCIKLVLPPPKLLTAFFESLVSGERGLWGSVLALVVVAPVTEELLFRGLILRGFLRNYSVRKSIIASALLFGALHLNPWQFVPATVIGLWLGWVYVKTRSLLPCIFAHALNNGLSLLGAIVDVKIRGFSGAEAGEPAFQPLWLDATGLAMFGLGLWLCVRVLKHDESAPPVIAATVAGEIKVSSADQTEAKS